MTVDTKLAKLVRMSQQVIEIVNENMYPYIPGTIQNHGEPGPVQIFFLKNV